MGTCHCRFKSKNLRENRLTIYYKAGSGAKVVKFSICSKKFTKRQAVLKRSDNSYHKLSYFKQNPSKV